MVSTSRPLVWPRYSATTLVGTRHAAGCAPGGSGLPREPFANSTINYPFIGNADGTVAVRQSAANSVGISLNAF